MKFYVSVLCPTRNKGCHSRLCGFFCIKWKSIQSYHYSCIEESSLFSKNRWCDKYLWIGLFHLIFWCKLLLLSKATFSFNLGKKTVPKYEGGHYFVSLGKRGAGKASSAQGHWMRAELAGVGAEVLYFFQSDLNICVCYLQPSLQPPGQSVLPDFFLFLFFLKEKSELNLAGRKAKLCPVTTKAVLWSTKPCGAVANTCVLSSRTLGGFCFLFSFNLLLLIVAYGSVMVLLLFFYF